MKEKRKIENKGWISFMDVLVQTKPAYSVTIEAGRFQHIGAFVQQNWTPRKIMIVTDHHVQALYYEALKESLHQYGFETSLFSFPAGEQNKSLSVTEALYTALAEQEFTRSDGLIALGGGVVGDLTGFVAATYMRGIPFIQIPTTLLAQVDSSIGGKTAINLAAGKNLVGAFYQPDAVCIDPDLLKTLSRPLLEEGLAEVIKVAAISDPLLWDALVELNLDDESQFSEQMSFIIYRCCKQKAKVVAADPYDHGQRMCLNFGHTIGHAIEALTSYQRFTHGEAVAIGMIAISRLAYKERWIDNDQIIYQLEELCKKFHLPTHFEEATLEEIYDYMLRDKKASTKEIQLIVVNHIGEYKKISLTHEALWEALQL